MCQLFHIEFNVIFVSSMLFVTMQQTEARILKTRVELRLPPPGRGGVHSTQVFRPHEKNNNLASGVRERLLFDLRGYRVGGSLHCIYIECTVGWSEMAHFQFQEMIQPIV